MQVMVSIIMPTYNRGYIISTAIESVISQSYKEWELIIVDDGSNDDTESVILKYIDDHRIRYYKLSENHGANYCRNFGIKNAVGKYLAFIDSDVEWKQEKLDRQVLCLENNSQYELTFCKTMIIRNEYSIEFPKRHEHPVLEPNSLKYGNFIDTNTVLVRKEVVDEAGGFDENLPRLQEWELFIRLILIGKKMFYYIDELLCNNYIQSDSISEDNDKYITAMNYIINKHSNIFLSNDLNEFIIKNISTDLSDFVAQNGKVYIYGAGFYGRFLKNYIQKQYGFTPSFVVSHPDKDDDAVGLNCLKKDSPIIIGVNRDLGIEIKKNLIDHGFVNWIEGYCWNC